MRADTADALGVDEPGPGQSFPYDAFISYDHDDRPVAHGIQRGLHRIGRRVGQLRALRVFRDSTDLSASPDLWGKVTEAMDRCRYLIAVLSPNAATSHWVNREVAYWLEHRDPQHLLFVVAGGNLNWDEDGARFDPHRSDAAPPVLTEPGALAAEPLWVDVSDDAPWDPEAKLFREKLTDLAAPIHGKPKSDLASEDLIAVIGMACRLPGGIDSPERLWEALLRGDDLITEIPPDRWDADEYYDPEPGVPGRSVSKWGAFLDDVAGFDSEFFGINEREATAIDPQHRLLLETSWEAMEHAGLTPETMADSLTGVFVGLTHGDYQLLAADAHAVEGPYGFTGNSFSLASGRVAYTLGVHGPALTVDTACSSGLTAVHLACRNLIDGESDLALAGGASVMLDPRKFVAGSAEGMLSPTGRCHAFDVAADGFVSSEGCVVVLLKRLPDALCDGDRILAVIRGTAANQDGHTVNIATPSVTAQTAVYWAALAAAGVDARQHRHGRGARPGHPGR